MQGKHEVAIVGGGISGCALLYILSRYSNIKSVVLLEKYGQLAPLNSSPRANSQTLHCGDIETNYTLEKAAQVKRLANMIVRYSVLHPEAEKTLHSWPKMVLGVGEEEVAYVQQRHEEFASVFPYMQLWDADRIAAIEPHVAEVDGRRRPEAIVASGCQDEVCAVDYALLAESFVTHSVNSSCDTQVHLNTQVKTIQSLEEGFKLETPQGDFYASYVVVSAGPHSLLFAHRMGQGLEYSILPVGGSFYHVPKRVNSKIYTVQNKKLPFAAIHADPDIVSPDYTRLGPTALLLPKLERYKSGSIMEFVEALKPDRAVLKAFWSLVKDTTIRHYMLKNLAFEVPGLRERLFLKDARKILPGLKLEDLRFAKGIGGLRPQVIDRKKGVLMLGAATIRSDKGALFNLTPSPGATNCLGNAYLDALEVVKFLDRQLDRQRIVDELLSGEDVAS